MRRASLLAIGIAVLFGSATPSPLLAAEEPTRQGTADETESPAKEEASPEDRTPAAKAGTQARARAPLPVDAAAALLRARAAYDYGDMNQVVEAARPVAEGLLPGTPDEQEQSFRLLGIGLYLTNRPRGAETAFIELLRKDPHARLDPTTTRPEVVAFFENLRRQQHARQRRIIWNFIPPVGQFQNEDNTKGWIILGVGAAALATAGTTLYLLNKWEQPGHIYPGHESIAGPVKTANWIAVGVLTATYVYGVFDGLIGYSKPSEESNPSVALKFFPPGGGLGFAF
jgi:hypothetical protein